MDYYIVRIYRREGGKTAGMTGLVEPVSAEGARVFRNAEELWRILSCPPAAKQQKEKKKELKS